MNRPTYRTIAWFAILSVALALTLLPFGGTGIAQNLPNLGDESAAVLTPQMERRIGEGYYRELRRDPAYLDDPEASGYVEELGNRLIAAGPEPTMSVEFFVMKEEQINAFAMLGGYIGVNSGLITAAQSESEVASVLGHEIGHLTQRHIARSVSASQRTSMASMVASALCLLAARSNPQVTTGCLAGAQAAQVQSQLAYSRDFEREADRVGFDILNKGGFDVTAMPIFFERLQRASRVAESSAPVYVRSHPLTTERIADVRNRVQGVATRAHPDSLSFHLVRAKLRATGKEGVDDVRQTVKMFATQVAEKTYLNETAAHFGLAYAHLLNKDISAAQTAFARISPAVAHPMIETLSARIRRAAGQGEAAQKGLLAAAKRHPQSRAIRLELIETLQAMDRHAEAIAQLRAQIELYRTDPKLHELLAKSFGEEGKRMEQHQSLGEYYFLIGALQASVEQFQLARCAGGGDFYQMSILDARIRTLWEALIRERADQAAGKTGSGPEGGGRVPAPVQGQPARC